MNISDEILANPTLRNVMMKFMNQQIKGIAKYGQTVNPASYDVVGWLNHKQQELIDGAVYAEVLIGVVSEIVEENKRLREALEFYANEDNNYHKRSWTYGQWEMMSAVTKDEGQIARKALEESK